MAPSAPNLRVLPILLGMEILRMFMLQKWMIEVRPRLMRKITSEVGEISIFHTNQNDHGDLINLASRKTSKM